MRSDEHGAAAALVTALQRGEVRPLVSYPSAVWRESASDPPDIVVDLGHEEVGVASLAACLRLNLGPAAAQVDRYAALAAARSASRL